MRSVATAVLLFLIAACQSDPGRAWPHAGRTRAADGVEIAYDVRGAGDTALVFIHGWCCNRQHWRHQLEPFAADHRVVTLDLAGHGESAADRQSFSVMGLAGDVQAVVEHLELDRVVLIGHSMGGPVALEAARLMPRRVIGVIGVDTLHDAEVDYSSPQFTGFVRAFEADFEDVMQQSVHAMFRPTADPAVVAWVADGGLATDREAALDLLRDFARVDLRRGLSRIAVPVRCINSDAMPTTVERNQKYADFDVVLMTDIGHYVMLERPDEFNRHLADTLRGLVAAPR